MSDVTTQTPSTHLEEVLAALQVGAAREPGRRASTLDPEEVATLLTVTNDLVAVTGFDGHFRVLSRSWQLTLGWTLEELRSIPYMALVHPDDRQRTEVAATRMRGDQKLMSFVNRFLCSNGDYKSLDWTGVADSGRERYYTACSDYAPTQLRRTTEAELSALIEVSGAAIVAEEEGLLIRWDGEAKTHFGWASSETVGRPTSELLHLSAGQGGRGVSLEALFDPDAEGPLQAWLRARDGALHPVYVRIAEYFLDSGDSPRWMARITRQSEGGSP